MTKNTIIGAIIGLAVIAGILWLIPRPQAKLAGSVASQCASGQTCLPSLELTGALSGVTNTMQVDAGKLLATATTSVGASLLLTPSGAAAPSCIEFYATSTATKTKLVFDTATTTPTATGYLGFKYGSCTN